LKTVRTHPKNPIINVRGLVLIYFLLCFLAFLFSRTFFSEVLQDGSVPGPLSLLVFFTIPAVLLVFLAISSVSLFRDMAARRTGSKFKARLLAYFITIVLFAAAPVTMITILSVNEVVRFWRSVDTEAAMDAAQNFALDAYSLHAEKFERMALTMNFDRAMVKDDEKIEAQIEAQQELPPGIAAVQDFRQDGEGVWTGFAFAGLPEQRLRLPPPPQPGFVSREMPRDSGYLRYILFPGQGTMRVLSYSLGAGFDEAVGLIESGKSHFRVINTIRGNIKPLLIFYYGVFFFPSLLMTVIIAMSFTRRVTSPIVELTEATRRVAEGDFSIQILARRGDELGLLIRSFNSMVQDLEKSRAALVKAEKISIWQSMAQQLAHEIKNPLTPIQLSAERVLRRWRNEPAGIAEILESSMMAIIQETEGLSNLLNEFRTLSKPMEPSQTWTKIRETVEDAAVPYGSSHPQVVFDISHIEEDISVKIDKHRLTQVLTNLIINGIDSMDGKGVIEIRTDIVKKRESRFCRLSIKDTGKGISKANGPLIFTPYFTTKESGTGLGLPIIERIVNDHGGAIWFNSAEGVGTTFFIDLPIDDIGTVASFSHAQAAEAGAL
jgi:nitrogen fixation/metabolism regulation signal transduction histidine kinase